MYVSKFTDDFSRMNEVYPLDSKTETFTSPLQHDGYSFTGATYLKLEVQQMRRVHLQGIRDSLRQLRYQPGVRRDSYAATEQGARAVEGTLAATTRCLLKDGNFPPNIWGDLFFTAVRLTNRSPHSTLGR